MARYGGEGVYGGGWVLICAASYINDTTIV